MSESAIINRVEQLEKTVTSLNENENINEKTVTSLNENENINNVCKDFAKHQPSHVENELVSETDKLVNGSRPTSPLPNGTEESLGEDRGSSVGSNEIIPTPCSAAVTKNVPTVEQLHSNLEIHHPNESSDSLKLSPSDVSLKQTSAHDSLSDCDSQEKKNIVEPSNSLISNTPEADEELCNDPMSELTDPLCCVDHSDLESFNGDDKLRKRSSETTLTGDTSSKVEADHETNRDSGMIESLKNSDLCVSIPDKESAISPNLVMQSGDVTHGDSSIFEKFDEPVSLTEESGVVKIAKESEPMDEDEENKDLLKISKVESCAEVIGGINESEKEEIISDVILQDEAKQETSDNKVEKIDSKEECKTAMTEELEKTDNDGLLPTKAIETVEDKSTSVKNEAFEKKADNDDPLSTKAIETVEDKSTSVENEASVEPDSAMQVSFKNILKKNENMEHSKDSKSADSDPEDTIVIDEVETLTNIHKEKAGAEEILISENLPIESTCAEKEDVPAIEGELAKKRTFDSSNEVSEAFSPKRQRLEPVVSELGDHHIEIKSSETTTVIMDSDDDSTPSPQVSNKTAKAQNEMETSGQTVKLSGEMLRNLIKASMKSFLKNQVLEKEQLINERMKKMEAAIDLWRETAKHLEKSMNELTSYTKEFKKCKSQSVKLKHLASRTVAVQVSLNQNHPMPANNSNHNRSTSLSLPPSVLRHPVPTQPGPSSNRSMAQSNGNMRPSQPTTPRQVGPGGPGPRGGLATPTSSQHPNRQRFPNVNQNIAMGIPQPSSSQVMRPMANNSRVVQQSGRALPTRPPMNHVSHSFQGSSSNMIDLTDEDDTSKSAASTSQRAGIGSGPPPTMHNNTHSSSLARGPQPEVNVINSSNNQKRSGGPGPTDKHNVSTKPVTGGSGQHVNNIKMNGTSMGPSTSKSGVPVNNSSLTNGPAASKMPPTELNSKAPVTPQPGTSASPRSLPPSVYVAQPTKHPAPLPLESYTKVTNTTKVPPPKPSLKISRVAQGIVLSWNMPVIPANVATIASYQLFAYQETNSAPSPSLWKKVGDVKALPLPMACTLVQFQEGNKYYFAVRAIDQFGRWGEYSDPSSIYLFPK